LFLECNNLQKKFYNKILKQNSKKQNLKTKFSKPFFKPKFFWTHLCSNELVYCYIELVDRTSSYDAVYSTGHLRKKRRRRRKRK